MELAIEDSDAEDGTPPGTEQVLTEADVEILNAFTSFGTAAETLKEVCVKHLGDDPNKWPGQLKTFRRLKRPMQDHWIKKSWKLKGKYGQESAAALFNVPLEGIVAFMQQEMAISLLSSEKGTPKYLLKDGMNRTYNAHLHNCIIKPAQQLLQVSRAL